jgi:hypothetical protein
MSGRTLAASQRTRAIAQHMQASTNAATSAAAADEVRQLHPTLCRGIALNTDQSSLR